MRIAILTAGGAGMFCGSCMHDNTWARALLEAGHDVTLLPTYTPIRVDELDASERRVFLGGINVYLEHKSRIWRRLPRWMTRWLDSPRVLKFATKFGVTNDAEKLGKLTLAMLAGEMGPQKREVDELAKFLTQHLKPEVILFSNALLVGALQRIREQFDGRIWCVLQGDDIYLEDLPEPYGSDSKAMISERAAMFDGFLTHSNYYREFMANYLSLPIEKFATVPLGIDLAGHASEPLARNNNPFTIGYFARICREKGLHNLLAAFRILHEKHSDRVRLVAGGYLSRQDRGYLDELSREYASLGSAFEYAGSPNSHSEKVQLLQSFDVLSVPTDYHEPKGLPVLEALANGIPVVQPRHGAFPELIAATGGGLLVEPGNAEELAAALERLMEDATQRQALGSAGFAAVREKFGLQTLATETARVLGN